MNELLLTYYGDDFTGSTDALEALSRGGVPTVLFLQPPTANLISERFVDVRAVGLAGMSRALSPTEMDATLPKQLATLQALGAPLCHYKVCSTFDSSPAIGSIGRAAEIGRTLFNTPFVPIVVGAPRLQRYLLFGNLFASVGDTTYRIDRHPTMSRHPVTPMLDGDLRRHLAKQTDLPSALVDVLALQDSAETIPNTVERMVANGAALVLFDTLDNNHLATIGAFLEQSAAKQPLYVIGSSGVEDALVAHWQVTSTIENKGAFAPLEPVEKLLVISGSASPINAEQIRIAGEYGFELVRLDVIQLIDATEAEYLALCFNIKELLDNGKSVVLYSALGPGDKSLVQGDGIGRKLAVAQGRIARILKEQTDITRLCIAGGDTCSGAVPQLDIFALQMRAQIAPGGPLCYAHSHQPPWDGFQIALKGGQIGQPDYFIRLLKGEEL